MKKPKIEVKKIEMTLKCILTGDELLQAGKDMADAQEAMRAHQSDLDRIMKDIQAKVVAEESKVITNASRIRSGYDFRNIACEVHFDIPASGQKTIYRTDTDEVVEVRFMTDDEKQRLLALEQEGQD